MAAVDYERAVAAQRHLLDQVADLDSVNAVGIAPAAEGYELKVNVTSADAHSDVPDEVDGVTVRVKTVGRLRKRAL